ncbi:MAG: permease [Bacilli bacterium]|nr:permease [Bacilli bacterium]MDD4407102.1 permease [Bacilli bacterium]
MEWLNDLIKWIVEKGFNLDINGQLGGSINFFLYDIIKIFILLSVLIYIISYIQSYFPPERTKKIIGKFKGISANIIGALLGTVTPFCSCSSIPLFIGFVKAGLPLGVTFSFLISSPLVDLASVLLLASIFNWTIAIAYVVVGLLIAIIGSTIISKLNLEKYVEPFVLNQSNISECICSESEVLTKKERRNYAKEQTIEIIKKVWLYVLIGVGIGTLIHNWIPQNVIIAILGKDNVFSVLIATLVGIPMYADIFGTLPIAEALVYKGVSIGTVLSFMMAVTALSLPSIIMLKRVVKMKLLVIFVSIVTIGILIMGYVFNYFSYLLI